MNPDDKVAGIHLLLYLVIDNAPVGANVYPFNDAEQARDFAEHIRGSIVVLDESIVLQVPYSLVVDTTLEGQIATTIRYPLFLPRKRDEEGEADVERDT